MFGCERCKMAFDANWRLTRHLNRKFPCKENTHLTPLDTHITPENTHLTPLDTHITPENTHITPPKGICKYCNCAFGKNLRRHQTICPLSKCEIRKLEIELNIPLKECGKLMCRFCNKEFSGVDKVSRHQKTCNDKQIYLESLKKKQAKDEKPEPQNITINNINNTQINIVASNGEPLRKFGDENFDALSDDDFIKIMRRGNDGDVGVIPMLVNKIHFNPNFPENKNIKLTNLRSEQIAVYNGERFVMKPVDNIIYKTIRSASNLMDEMYCTINEEKSNKCERDMLVRSTFNIFEDGQYDVRSRKDTRKDRNSIKCWIYNNSGELLR